MRFILDMRRFALPRSNVVMACGEKRRLESVQAKVYLKDA